MALDTYGDMFDDIYKKHGYSFKVPADVKTIEEINLNKLKKLQEIFKYPVGFSDHSTGNLASTIAMAMGSAVIEKHFTLDKNMFGPDHKFSCDSNELKELLNYSGKIPKIFGLRRTHFLNRFEEFIILSNYHFVELKSTKIWAGLRPKFIILSNYHLPATRL